MKIGSFRRKKSDLRLALDLIICLKVIEYQRLLSTCAPISVLPSNISTMVHTAYNTKYSNKRIFISEPYSEPHACYGDAYRH